MKKRLRMLATLLAAAMCVTACGNETTSNEKSSEQSSQPKESQATSEAEQEEVKNYWEMLDEVTDTSELPDWTGDTLEVTIWFAAGTDMTVEDIPDTDVAFKEFERVTGVKFNVNESYSNGGNSVDAKLPMVIASGDYPTMIIGYDIDATFMELYEEGYLADLTQYYEDGTLDQLLKWAPLEECSMVYDLGKDDAGKYFLVPTIDTNQLVNAYNTVGYYPEGFDSVYYNMYATSPMNVGGIVTGNCISVREDILLAVRPDAYTLTELEEIYVNEGTYTEEQIYDIGLESAEDFYELLRDIKEVVDTGTYTGLDGKPVEVTFGPNTETDNWYWMVFLPSMLKGKDPNADYFASYNTETQSIQRAIDNEFYVDFMEELNALVREDIISKNSLIDNKTIYGEKLANAHYAVRYARGCETAEVQAEKYNGYVYRPIWVDTDYYDKFIGFSTGKYNNCVGIFNDVLSDEEMEQLMHALNYLNSEVGINNFYWGPESAGLFTVDADGNRSYVDEGLHACMILTEDNGANVKYGLYNRKVAQKGLHDIIPHGNASDLYAPKYLQAADSERTANGAMNFYNPGILMGESYADHAISINLNCNVYGSEGQEIEGLADFWAARNAFEDQVKKTLAAETEADYEKQFQELIDLCEDNGLTEETLAEWQEVWVELNEEELKAAGLIK